MKQWLAIGTMSAGLVASAWAQAATPLHAKVSVNWDSPGIPVADALREIGTKANVEFVFEAGLVEHLDPVTLTMDETEAGRIAMRILYPRGLKLEKAEGRLVAVVKADPYDELRPKREEVFAFARKPTLTRRGDDVTIAFETQGWCDVTVAIEGPDGRIVRHLASGVLGPNAPEPFIWNSKAQTIVWDGKDDAGVYVDDKNAVTVRVSLGLKPQFERTLFWHPGKPARQGEWSSTGGSHLSIAAAPEGIFVSDGRGFDHVRLFDRDGNYVRTVYPFPRDKVDDVPGVIWHDHPYGERLPIKPNYYQSTLLQSGRNANNIRYRDGRYQGGVDAGTFYGAAGHALAVSGNRIALIGARLSRLATDGGSDGLNLHGPTLGSSPEDGKPVLTRGLHGRSKGMEYIIDTEVLHIDAQRAAFSPDGEWLYLTKHTVGWSAWAGMQRWRHHVSRMRYDSDETPALFLGAHESGTEDGQFDMPADVATDAQGRIYVADHRNDRIQVFNPEGRHLQTIAVRRPARICLHPETGEMYVFSWGLLKGRGRQDGFTVTEENLSYGERPRFFQLTRFSALPEAERIETRDLGKVVGFMSNATNMDQQAAVDFGSDPVRIWLTARSPVGGRGSHGRGLVLLTQENGEWTVKRDLLDEATRALVRTEPPSYWRQRLFVNPREEGVVYMSDPLGTSAAMSFSRLLRIDVRTGRCRNIELPMSAEDMAFSPDGFAYLKLRDMVVRYDPENWREVPFDYGIERASASHGTLRGTRSTRVMSGAVFPGGGRHHGGIHVGASGHIAVSAVYGVGPESRTDEASVHEGTVYRTRLYPGRRFGQLHGIQQVHVLDRHGRLLRTDAVPGLTQHVYGTAIDARGDIYLLESCARSYNGKPYFNDLTGTVMKFTPGQARIRVPHGAPVPLTVRPERPADLHIYGGAPWVEGAHWFYGGVGWGGFSGYAGGARGCHCPNPRFVLDYFARSFTPESHRYNVGVLDANGNLILRIGRYGNVDDGMPLVKDGPSGASGQAGPPNPRSIGPSTDSRLRKEATASAAGQASDEVALFDTRIVATHTDRRLFIDDLGNARVLSVKLGYHTDERAPLKGVPDEGRKE